MMALYAFVATPIQFWHHHNNTDSLATSKSNKKGTTSFSKDAGVFTEANCQVCTHQYASYCNGLIEIFDSPLFVVAPKNRQYYSSIPLSPIFKFSNKGPPVLA